MSSSDEGEVTSDSNSSNGRIFKKIRSNFTIVEKINFIVKKYDNNYFIDKELQSLTEVEEIIRPLQKVT